MREAMSARLLQREEEVASLQVELEKREHRLARAERVADVLEQTRSEVEQAQQMQRLNMHYNMASVYAREGRFAEAEYEYLQALRLDPSDADVHYNLGILYDDQLEQPEKALLHYRRYLQLNPHGEDADSVRNWVMRLEMREQR
jgi:tetratricopeptide (TPR) repeat protein